MDVTDRPALLRTATAEALVAAPREALALLEPGGALADALGTARAAASLAAKRASELVPPLHATSLGRVDLRHETVAEGLRLELEVAGVAALGLETEALTAACLAAVALCDALRPHAPGVEIRGVRVVPRRRGDHRPRLDPPVTAAVLVLSDSVAAGRKEDRAGRAVVGLLEAEGSVKLSSYEVLPDDGERLAGRVRALVDGGTDLVITVGGTGLGPSDVTVEALRPLLDREIPGVMEAARAYGQLRTPHAMLSRGIAGTVGDTLVLALPGSTGGATETYQALFPAVLHVFEVQRAIPHPHGYA